MLSDALGSAAVAIVVLMLVVWLVSIPLRDVSIVDITWGLGFAIAAWAARGSAGSDGPAAVLLLACVTIWGVRLAAHLALRNLGKGEDPRYAAMRRRESPTPFWLRSLGPVFAFQGVLMWIVALPVTAGVAKAGDGDVGFVGVLGLAAWTVGMVFEAVGDWQLARFKADPRSEGRVMDRGLWHYTRHPNYFGDACAWWGMTLIGWDAGAPWWVIVGPILMTTLLLRVSGVALLERNIGKRRPGYDEYVRRTSAFIPRPPRA